VRSKSASGPDRAAASPRRTRSSSHTRQPATPSSTRDSRCAARLAWAWGSAGFSAAALALSTLFSARSARPASQSDTQPGSASSLKAAGFLA
jgi:hypothetical protein